MHVKSATGPDKPSVRKSVQLVIATFLASLLLLSGVAWSASPVSAASNGQMLSIWCGGWGWEFTVVGPNQNGVMTRWSGVRNSSSPLLTNGTWWKGWVSVMGRPTPGYGSWTQFGQFNIPTYYPWGSYYPVC